eukprot:NODE_57_length_28844_cov_0.352687.p5 type:complete len:522 gc:universal NODE_57_length_28844_cov_0.352687:15871-14306(-)
MQQVERRSANSLRKRTLNLAEYYSSCDPGFKFNPNNNPRRVLTNNSIPYGNDGHDNSEFDYILYVNDVIGDKLDKQYKIVELLGCGTFGQVVKCIHLVSKRKVAVKIIKNKTAYFNQSMMEIKVLNQIYNFQSKLLAHRQDQQNAARNQQNSKVEKRKLGNLEKSPQFQTDIFQKEAAQTSPKNEMTIQSQPPFELPLIQLYDTFIFRKHLCLVFEILSINLYDLIKQNGFKGFNIQLVRDFTSQMLDALVILGQAKIVHCDLKPENILLCELTDTKIKVIDFGSACYEQSTMYTYVQSRFYRAPEVILGLDYSSSIDMWSLGCIVAELFLGLPIFPGTSEYNQICRIHKMLGNLPTYMLDVGKKTKDYFNKVSNGDKKYTYQLKSMEQFSREKNCREKPSKQYFQQTTLEDIIMHYPVFRKMTKEQMDEEFYNRHVLIDFIMNLLQLNPLKRFSPQQAKMHPFITGRKWEGPFKPSMQQVTSKRNEVDIINLEKCVYASGTIKAHKRAKKIKIRYITQKG